MSEKSPDIMIMNSTYVPKMESAVIVLLRWTLRKILEIIYSTSRTRNQRERTIGLINVWRSEPLLLFSSIALN